MNTYHRPYIELFSLSNLWLLHSCCCVWPGAERLPTTPPPHCCTAALAEWLSGLSGLISKQADLILMPCLQLFSPQSLSAERSSHESTDTSWSWYLAGHSPSISIQPSATAKINVFWNKRQQVGLY